ncbi:MAG: NADPH-dependent FMN reductase [Armatimonadota bacterium]
MAHVVLVETSPGSGSKSRRMSREVAALLAQRGVGHAILDLRTISTDPARESALTAATHVVFAVPVRNYDVGEGARSVIERLPFAALEGKTVGVLCAAGSNRSYMSVLPFLNTLLLEFHCWIVPRFVFATAHDFDGDTPGKDLMQRLEHFTDLLLSR